MYQVIAHYHANPGRGDDVVELLTALAEASRQEPENLSYWVSRSLEDADHFVIVESYTSADGFTAHREAPHFQEIGVGRIIPLLENRTVTAFTGDGSLS